MILFSDTLNLDKTPSSTRVPFLMFPSDILYMSLINLCAVKHL